MISAIYCRVPQFCRRRTFDKQRLSRVCAVSQFLKVHQHSTAAASVKPIDFTDTSTSLKSFSTPQLGRGLLVLHLCGIPPLVRNADKLLKFSYRTLGKAFTEKALKISFFGHFCAGETAEEVGILSRRLRSLGVGGILDYAAEAESGKDVIVAPKEKIVARQYPYIGESKCEAHADIFAHCIRAVRDQSPGGFAAIKVTALGDPLLLKQVSTCVVELRRLFQRLDIDGTGTLTPEEFEVGYRRLFKMETQEDIDRYSALLKQLTARGAAEAPANSIDYVEWSNRIEVEDLARISAGCKEVGPFARATQLLNEEAVTLLAAARKRVSTLAIEAQACGVRLMIDAEQTDVQPAIDLLAYALQRKHNKGGENISRGEHELSMISSAAGPGNHVKPTVYTTYQCYLKDSLDKLSYDLERARRGGYTLACKLVRGAYMVAEKHRAAAEGVESPVWNTIEETHNAYRMAIDRILERMAAGQSIEVMFATHNTGSVEHVIQRLADLGLDGKNVYFGQLLGMSDHVTFGLGARGYSAFKYLPYGPVSETLPYLLRRAQENSGLLGGAAHERKLLREEIQRRTWKRLSAPFSKEGIDKHFFSKKAGELKK